MPRFILFNRPKETPSWESKPGPYCRLVALPKGPARITLRVIAFLFLIFSALSLSTSAKARGLPAQEGILNFGKVSEHLYRGAQPDTNGIASLKRLGVKLIVNLRMPGDGWKEEEAVATANGILYTNFPMSGRGRPNEAQVRQLLTLFENYSDPIFVHCHYGCDRTGTIVACYRLQHDRWAIDVAMREARRYGISWLEFLMKRFVKNFGRTLIADSKFELRETRVN